MKNPTLILIAALGVAATGCATLTPIELTSARSAYARASAGPASQVAPTDLHKARTALDAAERAFVEEKASPKTIDLAYLADCAAQTAEARAEIVLADQRIAKAKQDYEDKQGRMAKKTLGTLATTREELTEAKRGRAEEAQQVTVERAARQEADTKAAASEERAAASDQKAKEANDALAKLAAKEDERGMVITLSGSVLFRSNDSSLLPAAQTRLDQVADVLIAKGHDVVIEGYTDSKGSQSRNMTLSQQRAESVRSYLVTRGFAAEKIVAKGMGPERPIAENTSSEGRANNRRVEIVIAKQ
jgi:outer membrane protein OmpA-like peptidoglycan-associated protein